jgi:hypothetical protein
MCYPGRELICLPFALALLILTVLPCSLHELTEPSEPLVFKHLVL